jgi:hypothetical protein
MGEMKWLLAADEGFIADARDSSRGRANLRM